MSDKKRQYHLNRWFGITEEQYEELLSRQQGKCGICNKDAASFPKRLAVDHDHVTGEIRGLLCTYCNRYLLGRHRSSDLLRRMADYLDRGTGWFVPLQRPTRKRRRRKSQEKGKTVKSTKAVKATKDK